MNDIQSTKAQLKADFDEKLAELRKFETFIEKVDYAALGELTEMRSVYADMRKQASAEVERIESELRILATQYKRMENSVLV